MKRSRRSPFQRARESLFRLILKPWLPFGVYFIVVGTVALLPPTGEIGIAYSLGLPWLLIAVLAVNLPLVAAAASRFRMTDEERRNHALEHGTIFFLQRFYEGRRKVGGRAAANGFRLSGIRKTSDVRAAFSQLIEHPADREAACVSRHCGSNVVTAQGLGVVTLTATLGIVVVNPLSTEAACGVLALNVVLYLAVRRPLGLWLQRRFFLLLDFQGAAIVSIKPVRERRLLERRQVIFVTTHVYDDAD